MKEKVKVGLALFVLLGACLVIEYFSKYFFDVLIFAICYLATLEFKKLQLKGGMPCFDYCPEIACFLVFVSAITCSLCGLKAITILIVEIAIVALFYVVMFVGSFLIYKKELEKDVFRNATNMGVKRFAFFKANNSLVCIFYPTLMMFFMFFINHISTLGLTNLTLKTEGAPIELFGLVLIFAICCLTDTFAMLFGCLIGGKKIFPRISPNKTLSGCLFGLLGGIVGSILTFVIFSAIFPSVFGLLSWWQFLVIGIIGSVLSQTGDLFESFIKRRAGVKEAGDFFRSHGGVLDRFDSIIFACPYVFICLLFLFA